MRRSRTDGSSSYARYSAVPVHACAAQVPSSRSGVLAFLLVVALDDFLHVLAMPISIPVQTSQVSNKVIQTHRH